MCSQGNTVRVSGKSLAEPLGVHGGVWSLAGFFPVTSGPSTCGLPVEAACPSAAAAADLAAVLPTSSHPRSSKFEQLVKPLLDRTVQVGAAHMHLGAAHKCTAWLLLHSWQLCTLPMHLWPLLLLPPTLFHAHPECDCQAWWPTDRHSPSPWPAPPLACSSPWPAPPPGPLTAAPLLPMPSPSTQPCHNCMKDAGVQPADIQEVLMVGGMSRMPKVRCRGC